MRPINGVLPAERVILPAIVALIRDPADSEVESR
jgi:hypothetical protein